MEEVKRVECPQCGGSGTCGTCSGRRVVISEVAEGYLDAQPITKGDAKALIAAAVQAASLKMIEAMRVEMAAAIDAAFEIRQRMADEAEKSADTIATCLATTQTTTIDDSKGVQYVRSRHPP